VNMKDIYVVVFNCCKTANLHFIVILLHSSMMLLGVYPKLNLKKIEFMKSIQIIGQRVLLSYTY